MSANYTYRDSNLWQKYLSPQGADDKHKYARARLSSSFEKTHTAIVPLVAHISQELPSLTMHDVTHVDALWAVADVLLGADFQINPIEVYVLGITFLLHDSATSSFAFPNGLHGLFETVQWKDFVAQNNFSEHQMQRGEEGYQLALFETLRLLHSEQAAELLVQSWPGLDGHPRYLLEDLELRNHYGREIGRISASHGIDAAAVESTWGYVPPIPPHSSLQVEGANWSVDCLKLALLLRCIDAAHIDSLRAPDMQAALTNPSGESKNHWVFQNKLSVVALNNKRELYWSGSTFSVNQSAAWWRCFETAKMVDKEVRVANRMLSNHGRPVLSATGVMGAGDISEFIKNVPVEGWQPIDFGFQVSQVGSVIEKFGGAKLYGDKKYLALKELIQNSSDAIRARRLHAAKKTHGRIDISLSETDGDVWLNVQDDGIGMSEYVLTDILLDFGRSLWKDPAFRQQWSGLASKGFTPNGQFGIGFFSVFMLGDEIKVTSWRYGTDIEKQVVLHLRNRVLERPILLTPVAKDRLTEPGTRISIRLAEGKKSLLRTFTSYGLVNKKFASIEKTESIEELVAYLAPTLDIDIFVSSTEEDICVIRANDWKELPPGALLKRLYPQSSAAIIEKYSSSVRNIYETGGDIIGRASISIESRSISSELDGVLVHQGIVAGQCKGILGVLLSDNNSDLARGNANPVVSASALTLWAHEQLESSGKNKVPRLSERVASLGVSDSSLIVGKLSGSSMSISDLIEHFKDDSIEELVFSMDQPECPSDMSVDTFEEFGYFDEIVDLSDCNSTNRFDFGLKDWIGKILPESDDHPKTLLNVLKVKFSSSFPNSEIFYEYRNIGSADDITIKENCLVIKK
ncbi:ATP-binding protein [Duganella sp. BJB1802]|uniref:HD domain-containing protein n=1 Tax=Duganella sp. BJB1802 TaxID=2744575 RepID=UPI00159468A5|nr:ATP-binding protein [Duganella sp. BJB1802]NVD69158.1 ATP-binding protein [Duganella sp. BJB1802]